MRWADISVLVIDDDAPMRMLLKAFLRQLNIRQVTEASDGRQGLVTTARLRPTIVLCDLHMEPVSGRTYLSKLRNAQVPDLAATPVIMVTADSSREAVSDLAQHKPNGYLVKPVSLEAVRKSLERALGDLGPVG